MRQQDCTYRWYFVIFNCTFKGVPRVLPPIGLTFLHRNHRNRITRITKMEKHSAVSPIKTHFKLNVSIVYNYSVLKGKCSLTVSRLKDYFRSVEIWPLLNLKPITEAVLDNVQNMQYLWPDFKIFWNRFGFIYLKKKKANWSLPSSMLCINDRGESNHVNCWNMFLRPKREKKSIVYWNCCGLNVVLQNQQTPTSRLTCLST